VDSEANLAYLPDDSQALKAMLVALIDGIRQSNAHCCAGVFGGALEL
jgi:hypothetical protein